DAAGGRDAGDAGDARDAGDSASHPPEPAAYEAYVADAERRCKPKDPESSTWGMVRDTDQYLGCHARGVTGDMACLAPEAHGALVEGDPASRPQHPEATGSLWSRTVDAVCELQSVRLWVGGGTSH